MSKPMNSGKKPNLVWVVSDRAKRIRTRHLLRFVALAPWYECVVVRPEKGLRLSRRIVFNALVSAGLIRDVRPSDNLDLSYYSKQDAEIARLSDSLARRFINELSRQDIGQGGGDISRDEMTVLLAALRVSLADMLYSRIGVITKLWGWMDDITDEGTKFFDPSSNFDLQDGVSVSVCVSSRELSDAYEILGNAVEPVDTVVLGSLSRAAYVDAFSSIIRFEQRESRSGFVFVTANPYLAPLADYFAKKINGPFGFLKRRGKLKETDGVQLRATLSLSPNDFAVFGRAANLIYEDIARALKKRLPDSFGRIAAQYLQVRDNPNLAGVSLVFASPSRSPVAQPLVHLFRSRGARVAEYQAFFWSAHPRYEVRDLDLFICSDKATMKIVEDKYRAFGSDTPVILGPSFALAEFLDHFQAARASRKNQANDLYDIGVALQPTGLDHFEDACAQLQAKGMTLLIRAHPMMNREETEARFSRYGKIDSGTLEDFLLDSRVIVTGFSNVAVQATACGRPVVCLPQPDGVGLDLAAAADGALICQTMDDLLPLVDSVQGRPFNPPTESALDQWMRIRRDLDAGVYDRPRGE